VRVVLVRIYWLYSNVGPNFIACTVCLRRISCLGWINKAYGASFATVGPYSCDFNKNATQRGYCSGYVLDRLFWKSIAYMGCKVVPFNGFRS
jgi:hypothetical protein